VPPLNIVSVGGQYELIIPNQTSVQLVDTEDVVQTLANAMADGIDEVVAQSEFIFAGGDALSDEAIAGIFQSASALALEAEVIYSAESGATLLEFIVDAGEALLAALA
jgi:hypothetical protein